MVVVRFLNPSPANDMVHLGYTSTRQTTELFVSKTRPVLSLALTTLVAHGNMGVANLKLSIYIYCIQYIYQRRRIKEKLAWIAYQVRNITL